VEEGQSTYEAEVPQIQSANPEAVFYAGYEIETPFLRYALVKAGVTVPMLASDGAFLSATIDDSDGAAEGLYVSTFAPSPAQAANPKWIEAYQVVEYRNPDTYSVNGYVAMQVLLEGVQKANSLDSGKIADALRGNSVSTLLNSLSYQANGDLVDAKIWVYQVVGGEFKQVEW
jgi:branched-chain amino acid transport system substrate-binding protein